MSHPALLIFYAAAFYAESTYKVPQSLGEYPTGAYPPKRTASVAKRKDAAYRSRAMRAAHDHVLPDSWRE